MILLKQEQKHIHEVGRLGVRLRYKWAKDYHTKRS